MLRETQEFVLTVDTTSVEEEVCVQCWTEAPYGKRMTFSFYMSKSEAMKMAEDSYKFFNVDPVLEALKFGPHQVDELKILRASLKNGSTDAEDMRRAIALLAMIIGEEE